MNTSPVSSRGPGTSSPSSQALAMPTTISSIRITDSLPGCRRPAACTVIQASGSSHTTAIKIGVHGASNSGWMPWPP